MISYQYIIDLFQGILDHSKAIEGRFHVSHRYGAQEINSDLLGEVLKEMTTPKKYPLSMLMPPHSRTIDDWERYRIILFFVKTTYYNQEGVTNQNLKTKTSQHTVYHDWHDMKRVAENFVKNLNYIQRKTKGSVMRIPPNQILTVPVSTVGADRVSGVRIDFDLDLYTQCTFEDYTDFVEPFTIIDSHPEHKL